MAGPLGTSRKQKWLYDALIVPASHTQVFDGEFQIEMYEVFHTRSVARWGHAICTPIANVGLLALAAELPWLHRAPGALFALDGAALAALIALAFYVGVHGAVALGMAPVLALAVLAAHALGDLLGAHAVTGALAVAISAAFVQTLTHIHEPVPPPC